MEVVNFFGLISTNEFGNNDSLFFFRSLFFLFSSFFEDYFETGKYVGRNCNTVKPIYIGRQVIRQSIMNLFPVAGVHTRIYFPRQAPWQTGRQTIFFFCLLGLSYEEMVGDRETRQPGGEFESTTGSVQVKDHERCRSLFHQPLTCWREWYPDLVKMCNTSFDMLVFVHPPPTKREDPPPSDIDGCDWNGLSVSFMT
jgi:hypothetical protein